MGRYLQQGWSCVWNPASILCRGSKSWDEYLLSLWAGCWAWLAAVLWHHLQPSNMPLHCCHLHIPAWRLNQVTKAMGILLLLLSLTVGKAHSVNTFLDGRAGEKPTRSSSEKFHYPILAAVFCLAAHLPLQVLKAVSELESLQCEVAAFLTCPDSHLASAKQERSVHLCQNLPFSSWAIRCFSGIREELMHKGLQKSSFLNLCWTSLSGRNGLVLQIFWETVYKADDWIHWLWQEPDLLQVQLP